MVKEKFISVSDYSYQERNWDIRINTDKNEIEYFCKNNDTYFNFEVSSNNRSVNLNITEFHSYPKRFGIGKTVFAYMLTSVLEQCAQKKVKDITISGEVSIVDENEWPDSLIAYQKLATRFALEFYITDYTREEKYKEIPDELKKDRYSNVHDFYIPKLGKVNSGNLHYSGNVDEVKKALERYNTYVQERIQKFDDEESRRKAKHNELIQKGLDEPISIIDKLKRKLGL